MAKRKTDAIATPADAAEDIGAPKPKRTRRKLLVTLQQERETTSGTGGPTWVDVLAGLPSDRAALDSITEPGTYRTIQVREVATFVRKEQLIRE